jgi:hypothetical protein
MKRHRQSFNHYFPPPYPPPPPPKKNPPPPRPLEELELGGEELSFVLPVSRPENALKV